MKFKKYILVLGVFFCLMTSALAAEPVDYVNPYIGTTGFPILAMYGGMIPYVTPPFGMTHWSPMTRFNKIGRMPYNYSDKYMLGFIGTHQSAVWMGDYGQVAIMPGVGKIDPSHSARKIKFDHKNEKTTPYYYSVSTGAIKTEMAASTRCSIFKIAFPESQTANIYFEASFDDRHGNVGYFKIEPDKKRIIGYNADRQSAHRGPPLPNFKGYFVIEFSSAFESYGTYNKNVIGKGKVEETGDIVGGYVSFGKASDRQVMVRIGTSFISLAQAEENLRKEIPDWDFNAVKNKTRDEWNAQLSRIEVKGRDEDAKVNFYTSMYHAFLFPRIFSEYGRYYSAFDDKIHDGVSYNDYSMWDTFRAEHPLLIFTASERVDDMITSMLQMYDEGGWLPKWPNPGYTGVMIGSHSDSIIADAYVKGFRNFDLAKAYEAVHKNAFVPPDGDEFKRWGQTDYWSSVESRGGLSWYIKLGYVPCDKTSECVSRTIEFSYDDFCVAQLAKATGNMQDYETLMARSKNYKNIYHRKFLRARNSSGRFVFTKPFLDITEGGLWTYTFGPMHDIPGLIALMGGNEKFEARLDKGFAKRLGRDRYRHDNEPGHHYAYLYNYCGRPWKTQAKVREISDAHYLNKPDGLSGNDDAGQMSAWYIFSTIGFYPVTPGTELYAIGSPQWDEVVIHVGEPYAKAEIRIVAENQSPKNIYIQSASWNGNPIDTPFLKHSDLIKGGTLSFVMGTEPNYKWGEDISILQAQQ